MKRFLLGLFCVCLLSGCASVPTDPQLRAEYEARNDPLEPMNRVTHSFNSYVNQLLYRPVSKIYRFVTPQFVRTGVTNFSKNAKQPVIFVNSILQGEFKNSAQVFGRFFTNSILGVGGLFDVASEMEIQAPDHDFGQTLYVWGFKNEGPYLVIPLLGPSNVRDGIGLAGEFFIDPVDWVLPKAEAGLLWWRYGLSALSTAERSTDLLWNIERTSVDPYANLRTMYQQNRRQFLGGKAENSQEDYDFEFEFDDEE